MALSYVIAHADGTADWFIAPGKVPPNVARASRQRGADRAARRVHRARWASWPASASRPIPDRAVAAIFSALEAAGATAVPLTDPVVLPKAVKNPAEQAGHRAAQARDGAAVARFLHWLSVEGPKGERRRDVRRRTAAPVPPATTGDLRDLSASTRSRGAGPNGAIVHYRVSEETNRKLEPSSVYLVDSGGQYPDGTTDITRTVWIGPGEAAGRGAGPLHPRAQGPHRASPTQTFPQGTTGSQLDTLARQFLWQAGLDYAHGTGHGVGSFLAVHEGPQRIAKPRGGQAGTEQELLAGMILSNEPGYYKTGGYGIRIENLVLVEERADRRRRGRVARLRDADPGADRPGAGRPLAADARPRSAWWNAYHARVREVLAPQLEGGALAWLEQACAPL